MYSYTDTFRNLQVLKRKLERIDELTRDRWVRFSKMEKKRENRSNRKCPEQSPVAKKQKEQQKQKQQTSGLFRER